MARPSSEQNNMDKQEGSKVIKYRTTSAVEYPAGVILPVDTVIESTEELPKHCFERV